MILLLPGKIQQTNLWKKMFTRTDGLFVLVFCLKYLCSMTKVLNLGFPGRRNIWKVDTETFFHSAIIPDLFEIFLESLATAAVSAYPRKGRTSGSPGAPNHAPRKHF